MDNTEKIEPITTKVAKSAKEQNVFTFNVDFMSYSKDQTVNYKELIESGIEIPTLELMKQLKIIS